MNLLDLVPKILVILLFTSSSARSLSVANASLSIFPGVDSLRTHLQIDGVSSYASPFLEHARPYHIVSTVFGTRCAFFSAS